MNTRNRNNISSMKSTLLMHNSFLADRLQGLFADIDSVACNPSIKGYDYEISGITKKFTILIPYSDMAKHVNSCNELQDRIFQSAITRKRELLTALEANKKKEERECLVQDFIDDLRERTTSLLYEKYPACNPILWRISENGKIFIKTEYGMLYERTEDPTIIELPDGEIDDDTYERLLNEKSELIIYYIDKIQRFKFSPPFELPFDTEDVDNCLKEAQDIFYHYAATWLTGISLVPQSTYWSYIFETDTFVATGKYARMFINREGEADLVYLDEVQPVLELMESQDFAECYDMAVELARQYGLIITGKRNDGVMFGSDELIVRDEKREITAKCSTFDFRQDKEKWKQEIKRTLTKLNRKFHEDTDSTAISRKQMEEDVMDMFGGNYLVRDIIELITLNDGYITANDVIDGLKTGNPRKDIRKTESCGVYMPVNKGEIAGLLDTMIRNEVISEKRHNSKYGTIYTLGKTELSDMLLYDSYTPGFDEAENKLERGELISDVEADVILTRYLQEPASMAHYVNALDLLPCRGMICKCIAYYLSFFKGAGSDFASYLNTKYRMEKDSFAKAIMAKIVKEVKAA